MEKNKAGQGAGGEAREGLARLVLNLSFRKSFTEKVTFEQRSRGGAGVKWGRGQGISGRGNSKCKEPEMGANLAWLSKSEKTSRAGAVSRWREKAMTSER